MLTASTTYDVTVNGRAMILAKQLLVSLPAGVTDLSARFVSGSPDESLTTDQPDGTNAVVGYSSRSLDFTITDTDGMFDPNNTASPLFGQEMHYLAVTYKEGLYPAGGSGIPELLTKFTGTTHHWKRGSSAKTITFTCLDGRDRLRSQTTLAAVVTAAPYNAGLTSEAALDFLLRNATNGSVSSSPAIRPQCVLSVPGRTTVWPEVGSLIGTDSTPTFTPGRYGSAIVGDVNQSGISWNFGPAGGSATAVSTIGRNIFMQFTVGNCNTTQPVLIAPGQFATTDGFQLNIYSNKITVVAGASHTWTVTVGSGFKDVKFAASLPPVGSSGTITGTIWLEDGTPGGTAHTFSVASGARTAAAWTFLVALLPNGATFEAFQVTAESSPAVVFGFTPLAVLDPSLNTLQVIPAVTGDPWQAIQQIADAEQGFAGFDENGIFRFKNRVTLRSGTSVRVITATNLLPIDPESDAAAKATHVQVGYTSWQFSNPTTVWSASSAWTFPAHKKTPRVVELDTLVAQVDPFPTLLPGSPAAGKSYYLASSDTAGVNAHPGGFTVQNLQLSSSRILVIVDNRSNFPVTFVAPATNTAGVTVGTPVFQIGGLSAMSASEVLVDAQWPPVEYDGSGGAVSNPAGDILQTLSGNVWIQDDTSARALAVDVLSQLHRAPIMLQNVRITPPDVRLQIGDRVTLQDPVSGINEPCTIWGQQRELSGGSGPGDALTYTHSIDARMVASRFKGWILGETGRGEIGVTNGL